MSLELKSMLIRHEGLKLKPYKDTQGILTVGVGRNIEQVGISFDEAMMLLENDISTVTAYADKTFPWFPALNQARQAVLLDMIFNMGIGKVVGFKRFLAAMQASDWPAAKVEMLNSDWAVEVGERADELADMITTGAFSAALADKSP